MGVAIQADEHVPVAISEGLKQQGIDVYTVEDEEIKGYDDAGENSILQIAQETGRGILTNDAHFESIHEREDHHGIIFITSQYSDIGDVIQEVVRLVDRYSEEEFSDAKFYVP